MFMSLFGSRIKNVYNRIQIDSVALFYFFFFFFLFALCLLLALSCIAIAREMRICCTFHRPEYK